MEQKYTDAIARIRTAITRESVYSTNTRSEEPFNADIDMLVDYINNLEFELEELQEEYDRYKDKVERYEDDAGVSIMSRYIC